MEPTCDHDPPLKMIPESLLENTGWLRSLARGLVDDRADVDDVVQDARVAALVQRPPLRETHSWLASVVRNLARKRRRAEIHRTDRERSVARPEHQPSHVESLERFELQRVLLEAIEGLEEPIRTAIVQRYFENRSSNDIEQLTGVPAATVRARVKRGLELLRARLDADHPRDAWVGLLAPLGLPGLSDSAPLAPAAAVPGVLTMGFYKAAVPLAAIAGVGLFLMFKNGPAAPPEPLSGVEVASVVQQPVEEFRLRPVDAEPTRVELPVETATPASSARPSEEKEQSNAPEIEVSVLDSEGKPARDARVRAQAEASAGVLQPGSMLNRRTGPRTDALGMVRITDLQLGEYRVYAEAERHAPAISPPIFLTKDEPRARIQIDLSVGGRVVGQLQDIQGRPGSLIGMSIHPDRREGERPALTIKQVTTDVDGKFEFTHLPAGTWNLWTRAKGTDVERVPSQKLELEVLDGQTTEARFKDLSGSAVQVAGQVLRNGAALPGASINVHWADPTRAYFGRSTKADQEGRFEITMDEGGDYRFQVSARPAQGSVFFVVSIPQISTHSVVLAYESGSLAGTVFDPDGRPIVDAEVRAFCKPKGGVESAIATSKTNQEGHYELPSVLVGSCRVSAQPPQGVGSPFISAGWSEEVTIEAGRAMTVDVRLGTSGSIVGRTIDIEGKPIAGSQVGFVRSDAEGRFIIEGAEEGQTWLRATHRELTSNWTSVSCLKGQSTSVDLVLVPGGEVIVEVEDAAGPIEKAFLSLLNGNEMKSVHIIVQNGKGTERAVPAGTYKVTAQRDYRDKDGPKVETTLTVVAGEKHVLQLRLP